MRKYFLVTIYIFCFAFGVLAQENKQACPNISVIGPAVHLSPGGTAMFTVNLDNAEGRVVTYQWTIGAGEIENGQGAQSISVHIPTEALNITSVATVRVVGLAEGCPNIASTKFIVGCGACDPMQFDEYGNIRFADERPRLDRFAKEVLSANKTTGYIIRSFSNKTSLATKKRKIREIERYLFETRKYPKDRFIILVGAPIRLSTKLYIIPRDPVTNKPVDINR